MKANPLQTTIPSLSVIVATPDNYATVHQLILYLAQQTICDRIEIVFVVVSQRELHLNESEMGDFWGYQIVEIGPFRSLNHARVSGIVKACAPIVVLTEDHCFPMSKWAESLVKTHQESWVGVGPAVGLANLHCARSWANYLIQYEPWIMPQPSGEIMDIPGHNSSYKKKILIEYGERLENMMDFEFVLHEDLRKKGYRLYMDTEAKIYHVFMTKFVPFIHENFNVGRLLAASRAREFSPIKHAFYLITAPVIPFIRFYRVMKTIFRLGWQRALIPRIIPWLAIGYCVGAAGEFIGYLFGKGNVQLKTMDLDFHRHRFVSPAEKQRIWSEHLIDFTTLPTSPQFD